MKSKLLNIIIKDIERVKKMVCTLDGASELKLTLSYGSYDDLDLYMAELSKKYTVYRYSIEIFRGVYITINFQ